MFYANDTSADQFTEIISLMDQITSHICVNAELFGRHCTAYEAETAKTKGGPCLNDTHTHTQRENIYRSRFRTKRPGPLLVWHELDMHIKAHASCNLTGSPPYPYHTYGRHTGLSNGALSLCQHIRNFV